METPVVIGLVLLVAALVAAVTYFATQANLQRHADSGVRRARAEAEEWSWDAASDDLLRIYEQAITMHGRRERRSRS